jgi:hypothetical protein
MQYDHAQILHFLIKLSQKCKEDRERGSKSIALNKLTALRDLENVAGRSSLQERFENERIDQGSNG